MFLKKFDIRWSDLDPNRHLANSAYINFMSSTRLDYMFQMGLNDRTMTTHKIGPVVFKEDIFYYKEAFAGQPVYVSLEVSGLSEDGSFFSFIHNFYDAKGNHLAQGEMLGAWIHLETRKVTGLPSEFLTKLQEVHKTENFRKLTKENTRQAKKRPVAIDLQKELER